MNKKLPLPLWERVGVRGLFDIIINITLPFVPSHQGRGTVYRLYRSLNKEQICTD